MDSWIYKYEPQCIDDLILNSEIKDLLKSYLKKNTIPNILFYGRQGLGKTVTAKILVKELDATSLFIPCGSRQIGVDYVRTKIVDFCNSVNFKDTPKIVLLDEFDQVSQDGMGAFRNLIEENRDDCRFILTCNYINKVIPPIQSRCTPISIQFNKEDIAKRLIEILKKEKINFSKEELKTFTKKVIIPFFPDIRSIINQLELYCHSGELKTIGVTSNEEIGEVIGFIKNNIKNPRKIREFYIQNEDKFNGDYELLANELFRNYYENGMLQILIAEFIYRMSLVADKEIQFYAMLLEVSKNLK